MAILAAAFGFVYLLLFVTGLAFQSRACVMETRKVPLDLPGYELAIERTYCSGFGADASLSILASKSNEYKKIILFKYDPGNESLPTITIPSARTMLISVEKVSSIYYQASHWEELDVKYDIGRVFFK